MGGASPFLRPLAEDEIEILRTIERAARIRYRALGGLWTRAANGPAIAPERFADGETIVAEFLGDPVGFVLFNPLDELLYVANIAVSPEAAGLGIGRLLMIGAERRAQQSKVAGLSLATFRTHPGADRGSAAKAICQFQRNALVSASARSWTVMRPFTICRRGKRSGSRQRTPRSAGDAGANRHSPLPCVPPHFFRLPPCQWSGQRFAQGFLS
jgi:GNAT superfamily N-acetyltransferase